MNKIRIKDECKNLLMKKQQVIHFQAIHELHNSLINTLEINQICRKKNLYRKMPVCKFNLSAACQQSAGSRLQGQNGVQTGPYSLHRPSVCRQGELCSAERYAQEKKTRVVCRQQSRVCSLCGHFREQAEGKSRKKTQTL